MAISSSIKKFIISSFLIHARNNNLIDEKTSEVLHMNIEPYITDYDIKEYLTNSKIDITYTEIVEPKTKLEKLKERLKRK